MSSFKFGVARRATPEGRANPATPWRQALHHAFRADRKWGRRKTEPSATSQSPQVAVEGCLIMNAEMPCGKDRVTNGARISRRRALAGLLATAASPAVAQGTGDSALSLGWLEEGVTLQIGEAAYPTLEAGLVAAARLGVGFSNGGISITLNIVSGTSIAEQLVFDGIDLSWIAITSDDATVPVERSALTAVQDVEPNDESAGASYPFLFGRNGARLPRISCLFDMDTRGPASGRDGILLLTGASVVVDPGCGIDNAGGQGLYGYGAGSTNISGARFRNAGRGWKANGRGIWWRYSGMLHANYVTCDGALWSGLQIQSSPFSAVSASARKCGHYGFRARGGATGSARGFVGSGSAGHGFNINEGASVELTDAVFENCGIKDNEPAGLIESSWADIGGVMVSGQYNGVIECRGGHAIGVPKNINSDVNGTKPYNVQLRATRGGTFSGAGLSAHFTANLPYNIVTAHGSLLDSAAPTGITRIKNGEITVTHGKMLIVSEDPGERRITTVTLPFETPDGTELVLQAATDAGPISIRGDLSGNVRTCRAESLTLDGSDTDMRGSIDVLTYTTDESTRIYEKGCPLP